MEISLLKDEKLLVLPNQIFNLNYFQIKEFILVGKNLCQWANYRIVGGNNVQTAMNLLSASKTVVINYS